MRQSGVGVFASQLDLADVPAPPAGVVRITKQDVERIAARRPRGPVHQEVKNVDEISCGTVNRRTMITLAQIQRAEEIFEIGHTFAEEMWRDDAGLSRVEELRLAEHQQTCV